MQQYYWQMQSVLGDDQLELESFSNSENLSSYRPSSSSSPKSSTAYLSDSTTEYFQTANQLKTATVKKGAKGSSSSSSSCLISFGNSNPIPTFYGNLSCNPRKPKDEAAASREGTMNFESLISHDDNQKQEYSTTTYGRGTKRLGSTRNPSQSREHVIAERKRRVKVNQRFIALSATVPGLKKVSFMVYGLYL